MQVLGAMIKATSRQGKEKEEAIAEVCEALKTLEDELKGKRFFGGDTLGFVDIVANFVAYWIPAIEEGFGFDGALSSEMEKLPNLRRWCNEFVEQNQCCFQMIMLAWIFTKFKISNTLFVFFGYLIIFKKFSIILNCVLLECFESVILTL